MTARTYHEWLKEMSRLIHLLFYGQMTHLSTSTVGLEKAENISLVKL